MESKAVATLELFKVSSLNSSGIMTKFLANKSVADSATSKQVWRKENRDRAGLMKFYENGILQMPSKK